VGLTASVGTLKNKNISWPCRGSNPTPSPDCRLVTALTMQFHLLKPDISTCSIWMVLSDITWHLCHSTYISVSETEHSIGHSKIQFAVTSSSIMYFSRFSQQLLKYWVSLGPLCVLGFICSKVCGTSCLCLQGDWMESRRCNGRKCVRGIRC
jgi:hypothetical protein